MAENTKKMNAVIASVKSQGVEDKDLKTTSFNIYPRYEWYDETEIPNYSQGKRVLVGYEIYQSLQVKIRDMKKIGDIIEGGTTAGANQIGDLQLTVDKQDELKKQAQEEAKQKAKDEINRALEKVSESTLKNQEVLLRIYQLVPEPAQEAIEKVIKLTKIGYERATEAVSGIKKEELQQKAEEIKIRAQELIKNWKSIFGE